MPAARRIPPPTTVPAPPSPFTLDPLLLPWNEPLLRVYDISFGAREFYAGNAANRGRFHPFHPGRSRSNLPVLYAASDLDGALSETVFHDVPMKGTKHVPHSKLLHRVAIALAPTRTLNLVDLSTPGLRRINLTRSELIESDPRSYPDTARWAKALHDAVPDADGLAWMSRQHDTSRSIVLFGDRVRTADLHVDPFAHPVVLATGAGFEAVSATATRAGITITGLG